MTECRLCPGPLYPADILSGLDVCIECARAALRASRRGTRAVVVHRAPVAPAGADVDRVLMAGDALTTACESYRLPHHPDAQRVVAGLYEVFAIDHDGEPTRIYDGTAEYAPKEATR